MYKYNNIIFTLSICAKSSSILVFACSIAFLIASNHSEEFIFLPNYFHPKINCYPNYNNNNNNSMIRIIINNNK